MPNKRCNITSCGLGEDLQVSIEYYDAIVLSFIGNRIGTIVKVDRNTLNRERAREREREREKYARVCIQVDITKHLLAMFAIKGRHFKVEYEGLHLLCLNSGCFGHYKEE